MALTARVRRAPLPATPRLSVACFPAGGWKVRPRLPDRPSPRRWPFCWRGRRSAPTSRWPAMSIFSASRPISREFPRGDAVLFSLPAKESADTPHRPGDEGGAPSSPDGGAGPSQSQHSGEKADFPRPKDISELERLMLAVSPDDLDFGRTPKTTIEEVARLAKVIVGRRKKG